MQSLRQAVVIYHEVETDAGSFRSSCTGRADVHEENRTGRPSVISDVLLRRTEEGIKANRLLTLRDVIKSYRKYLRRAIQNKRRDMLASGVCLLHDSARPHTAHKTEALLKRFKWEVLDNPPYSTGLAPSDFHLFLHLKRHLAGQNFHDDDENKNGFDNRR
ncbi:hypothetical protein AVEN_101666-1 [Araneus ventricosus]|uniref:Histone-lysine N-methyltransferase SETMAR n=1 Tax=Araneus ventricosus TaxID=182803 RepID=A0A4Y2GJX4_ARAVE|nr:hypothetical protein AVEN_101666-1 [Araneus ventricosus]